MDQGIDRRKFLLRSLAAAAAGPSVFPHAAHAQAWPAKSVRVIVGFPAGGLTDLYARAYSDYMSQQLGQPFVVENRPGAGSIIACEAVAKAPADGYTFLFTIWTAIVQNQVLYRKLPYDPNKDFSFISSFDPGHLPLAVHTEMPVKDFRGFVDFARKNRVTLGTYSAGSYPHMVAAQLNKHYGTQIEPVHFKGEAPMWVEVSTGRIHGGIGSQPVMGPHIQKGTIRPIAVPTLRRAPKLPDVPTFAEQGFQEPVFKIAGWIVMLGPAGLPRDMTQRLAKLAIAAADTPRIKEIHATFGILDNPSTPEEFERRYKEDGPIWLGIVRELGVTLD